MKTSQLHLKTLSASISLALLSPSLALASSPTAGDTNAHQNLVGAGSVATASPSLPFMYWPANTENSATAGSKASSSTHDVSSFLAHDAVTAITPPPSYSTADYSWGTLSALVTAQAGAVNLSGAHGQTAVHPLSISDNAAESVFAASDYSDTAQSRSEKGVLEKAFDVSRAAASDTLRAATSNYRNSPQSDDSFAQPENLVAAEPHYYPQASASASGITVPEGGTSTLDHSSIVVNDDGEFGVHVLQDGHADLLNSSVTVGGMNSIGIIVGMSDAAGGMPHGASANIVDTSFNVGGESAGGVLGTNVTVDNVTVHANGKQSIGLLLGGASTVEGGSIFSEGEGSVGLALQNTSSASHANLTVSGSGSTGMVLNGNSSAEHISTQVTAHNAGAMLLSGASSVKDSTITLGITARDSFGISLNDNSSAERITVNLLQYASLEANAVGGVLMSGHSTIRDSSIHSAAKGSLGMSLTDNSSASNVEFQASGEDSLGLSATDQTTIKDSRIATSGERAKGVLLSGSSNIEGSLIEISGKNSRGIVQASGTTSINDSTIHVKGDDSHGFSGGHTPRTVGQANINNSTIVVDGMRSSGIYVWNNFDMSADNIDIFVAGNNSVGITGYAGKLHEGDPSGLDRRLEFNNINVESSGDLNAGMSLHGEGLIAVSNSSIHVSGEGSEALGSTGATNFRGDHLELVATGNSSQGLSVDKSAKIVDSTISVSGSNSIGMHGGGDLERVRISSTGADSLGIQYYDDAILKDSEVRVEGQGSHGVEVSRLARLQASNSKIDISSAGGYALFISNGNVPENLIYPGENVFNADRMQLIASGDRGMGVFMNTLSPTTSTLTDSTVMISGEQAIGARIDRGSGHFDNVRITASGTNSFGAKVSDRLTLIDSKVNTEGEGSSGIQVLGRGRLATTDTQIHVNNSNGFALSAQEGGVFSGDHLTLTAIGNGTTGVLVDAYAPTASELINSTIEVSGSGAVGIQNIQGSGLFEQVSINATGEDSLGVRVSGKVALNESDVRSEGARSHGIRVLDSGRLTASGTKIDAISDGGYALSAENSGAFAGSRLNLSAHGDDGIGVFMNTSSLVASTLAGSNISTSGNNAIGVRNFRGVGSFEGISINAHGDGSLGIEVQDRVVLSGSDIHVSGTGSNGVKVHGNGRMEASTTTIDVASEGAVALAIAGQASAVGDHLDLTTQGDNATGVLMDTTSASSALSNSNIELKGANSVGLRNESGLGWIDRMSIKAISSNSLGAQVRDGLALSNSRLDIGGAGSNGVRVIAGGQLDVSDTDINISSDDSFALSVSDASTVNADKLRLTATGADTVGVLMDTSATNSVVTNSTIALSGTSSIGIRNDQGQGRVESSSIKVSGSDSSAVQVRNRIALSHSIVDMEGTDSHGIRVLDDGQLSLSTTKLDVKGDRSVNLSLHDTSALEGSRVEMISRGDEGVALLMDTSSRTSALTDATIVLAGSHSTGISNERGQASFERLSIETSGSNALGIRIRDQITLKDSTISIKGADSNGIRALDGGRLDVEGATIVVASDGGYALSLEDDATFKGSDLGLMTSSNDTTGILLNTTATDVALANSSIDIKGMNSVGVQNTAGQSSFERVSIKVSGNNSLGTEVQDKVTLNSSTIAATGANSVAARVLAGGTLHASNSTLYSAAATALHLSGGSTLWATDGTVAAGNAGTLASFGSDVANTLIFSRKSSALGDIRFSGDAISTQGTASLERTSTLSLDDESYWKGATDAIGNLSLTNGSRWDLISDSHIGSLDVLNSTVAFEHGDGRYHTLVIDGDFHADNGLIAMNTKLGDDSTPTDRVHVLGGTFGTASIRVNNIGGTGAQTKDGIQLIQVDGPSEGRYTLSGRAVGGMYDYFLFQGGTTRSDDGHWYLRSELPPGPDPDPVTPDPDPVTPDPDPVTPDPDPLTPDPELIKPDAIIRPEAGAYLVNQAMGQNMFRLSRHDRGGDSSLPLGQEQNRDAAIRTWVRTASDQSRMRLNEQLSSQGRQNLTQVGADVAFDRSVVGLMLGTGNASSRTTSRLTSYGADGRLKGQAIGLYGTWAQPTVDGRGLHVDGWIQKTRLKSSVNGDMLTRERYRASSTSGGIELDYTIRLKDGPRSALYLEPQFQEIWTSYRMGGGRHQEANGTVVQVAHAGGRQTRVGARLYGHGLGTGGTSVEPFAEVNWIHNSGGPNAVLMNEQRSQGALPHNLLEAKVGAKVQLTPGLKGWGELNVQRGQYGFRSVGAQLGLKYAW